MIVKFCRGSAGIGFSGRATRILEEVELTIADHEGGNHVRT